MVSFFPNEFLHGRSSPEIYERKVLLNIIGGVITTERQIEPMSKYNIEQFVGKIKAPCVVRIGETEMSFDDGAVLSEHQFDKRYLVD